MKRIILGILLLNSVLALSQGKSELSFSVTTGENEMIMFHALDGAATHRGEGFFALNMHYRKPIKEWLDFESGLAFAYHSVVVEPLSIYDILPIKEEMYLASIPIGVKFNFLRYFFVNAGTLVDIDFTSSNHLDDQSGIGASLGASTIYRFDNGIGIFAMPCIRMHSLIPFTMGNYHERLLESGIQFGISYRL